MPASSFFALLDDIATVLDDVALMSKAATKKTAGVLSDDLALNAQQVSGVKADRELPVVWAVAKGSLLNKVILLPLALLISLFAPWLITPLLMIGGAYLCFEGMEKIWGLFFHPKEELERKQKRKTVANAQELLALEKKKIRGAIRTDFILSAEIIVIALGVMSEYSFVKQCLALSFVAIGITVAVYGVVAVIVKIDDAGLFLANKASLVLQKVGAGLLWFAPQLMKMLSILGTAAMFLVGGGIWFHAIAWLHHIDHSIHATLSGWLHGNWFEGVAVSLASIVWQGLIGLIVGAIVLLIVTLVFKAMGKEH